MRPDAVERSTLVEDRTLVVDTPPASDITLVGVLALVVDEDHDCRELFRLILETAGATVVTASGAREALSQFLRLQPHVVVSELSMRDEDGYWLARRVRASLGSGDRRPALIAVTVHHDERSRQRGLDAGFDEVLTKPVDPFQFTAVVQGLLSAGGIF
jgi:CheY-like chemotaxis protein